MCCLKGSEKVGGWTLPFPGRLLLSSVTAAALGPRWCCGGAETWV